MRDILRNALDSGRPDNRGCHACRAECESKRHRDRVLDAAMQKIVVELLKPVPIWPGVPIAGWLFAVTPRRIGDRPLDDHAHPARARLRQYALDRLLVRDAHRYLQSIECAPLDRVYGVIRVDAASHETRLSALARLVQNLDDAAVLQSRQRRAVELHDIDMVGAQVLETALYTAREHRRLPIRLCVAAGALGRRPQRRMPAFRHEDNFGAAKSKSADPKPGLSQHAIFDCHKSGRYGPRTIEAKR